MKCKECATTKIYCVDCANANMSEGFTGSYFMGCTLLKTRVVEESYIRHEHVNVYENPASLNRNNNCKRFKPIHKNWFERLFG